ncbi:hypothetical protein K437DRAFT_282761 [Tilletiaria anomala UBC 951]|uniref:Uncharacterized protein n=1 Tax=Tilletiaria anomala (strain ATCC 24038 / CBS 436.72 / UBC 951) TaxID=1037660 RepID=A0A066WE61_TILAU|nr:uncharacterized protein K437DRAFT_282761 [Tilletiaria anomala UBC 951]KDN50818.1 hypothetical protein K437DRAFT_282761 [Tilletiaria anomala UBC 951]
MLRSFVGAAAAVLVGLAALPLASAGNLTSLEGTWSSGSGSVQTGLNFFNPATNTFTTPKAGGISYSFTGDGHWEQAKYMFNTSSAVNRCVTAYMIWQHGTYTINANGSLSLSPFPADGYMQMIDICGRQTIKMFSYNQFELIPQWYIYLDSAPGFLSAGSTAYALQMFQDGGDGQAGKAMAPLFLTARPANMLPTTQLHEQVINQAFRTT